MFHFYCSSAGSNAKTPRGSKVHEYPSQCEAEKNLNSLCDKLKDHFGVVFIDVGILISSLSVNEIKDGN